MNRLFDRLPILGDRIPGKITLSFLMLFFAILMFNLSSTLDRVFCIIAMLFSFIGDIILNYKRNPKERLLIEFLCGGVAFMGAHIFYCVTYAIKIYRLKYSFFNWGFVFAIVILVALTFFISSESMSRKRYKSIIFALTYLWITGINYVTIFSFSYSSKSIASLATLGGLFFLASDVIIGLENFSGLDSKIARGLVWWLYPIGQILLIAMA